MKQKTRRSSRTGRKRKAKTPRSGSGLPDLARAPGGIVPATAVTLGGPIWENDVFAVTREGLAMKPPMRILIPREHLPLVGGVAKTLAPEQLDTPFGEAIDHAVRILLPDEFPDGLKSKREPEGSHND